MNSPRFGRIAVGGNPLVIYHKQTSQVKPNGPVVYLPLHVDGDDVVFLPEKLKPGKGRDAVRFTLKVDEQGAITAQKEMELDYASRTIRMYKSDTSFTLGGKNREQAGGQYFDPNPVKLSPAEMNPFAFHLTEAVLDDKDGSFITYKYVDNNPYLDERSGGHSIVDKIRQTICTMKTVSMAVGVLATLTNKA